MNANVIEYAQEKIASVRRLYRTSLPIPYAGGTYPAKPLSHIVGGLLSFESDWQPALGGPLMEALTRSDCNGRLDLGCVASHGTFELYAEAGYVFKAEKKPATAFLLELTSRLQDAGTVPMIDIRAYAKWLAK
jgi:hypothetical protein